jgi:hypothetical protein
VRISDETGAYSFSVSPGSYTVTSSGGGCSSLAPPTANLNNITSSKTQNFAGTSCPPAPLALCPELDTDFIGVNGGAACATVTTPSCPDAVGTWDNTIVLDFAIALTSDCRFGRLATLLSADDVTNYLNSLLGFGLQFFGCPFIGTLTGPLTDGLIPAPLQSHAFSTADLSAMDAIFAAAVAQAFSDSGLPPLSASETNAINAQLAFLASKVPGTVNSPNLTLSTCGDAGP